MTAPTDRLQAPDDLRAHEQAVARLRRQYDAIPAGSPVRLAKRTTNLFRPRQRHTGPGLDVASFDQVLSVDQRARTAVVQGMTTYEHLVDATLAYGLMPLVVPQLKTITIGGAVTGLGIESSSFHAGLPHESVLEIEVLTGSGEVVRATPDGPHADLFRAFPNSYGTLGYALSLTIELVPVQPYVHLRHVPFDDLDEVCRAVGEIVDTGQWRGEPVDFLDGSMFPEPRLADRAGHDPRTYLTLGSWSGTAPYTNDYAGQKVYYRSVQQRSEDYLAVRDYLWRWDTDWFWCSRVFGVQNPRIRRLVPRRYLRSDVYQKIVGLENRYGIKARLDARKGELPRERVVQDVEVPLDRTADFLRWFVAHVPIEPVWLCPLRLRRRVEGTADGSWPLYPLKADRTYVNVGFWSTVAIEPGAADGDVNRAIELAVTEHDGHKGLYSDAYYPAQEFWQLYGGETYHEVKQRYDPQERLLDLYEKAVRRA
ncbi:MAG TPA: FAD-binding oxidoreductase [Actinomycetales bacterium]|nr:FAD-binding oxidoreductase [Actinomycetales bacterium]